MAFHNLTTDGGVKSRAPQAQPNEVFIALYRTGKTENTLTMSIRFGGKIMEQLGWKRGDFVTILEGDGDDAGMLQVEKTTVGTGRRLTDPSGMKSDPDAARLYILAKIFRRHRMPKTQQMGEPVEFRAYKGKLVLRLPSWAPPITPRERTDAPKPASRLVRKASR